MAFSDFRWWGLPYKIFSHLNEQMFVFILKSVYYNNARRIGEFEIERKEFIKSVPIMRLRLVASHRKYVNG